MGISMSIQNYEAQEKRKLAQKHKKEQKHHKILNKSRIQQKTQLNIMIPSQIINLKQNYSHKVSQDVKKPNINDEIQIKQDQIGRFDIVDTKQILAIQISAFQQQAKQQNWIQITKWIQKGNLTIDIEQLNLQQSNISRIIQFCYLPKLKILRLYDNCISKIQNLDRLSQLTSLYLSHNNIRKIQNLDKLVQLQILNLNNNKIRKVQNLERLKSLKTVNLQNNPIDKDSKAYVDLLIEVNINVKLNNPLI